MSSQKPTVNESLQILMVEDSPSQAERLRYFLQENNFRVLQAGNGKEALSLLKKYKPSLVISDVIMPEMTGYELCKHIKSQEYTQELPVILLTSLADTSDVLEGLVCGADAFIIKPFRDDVLLKNIGRILSNKKLAPKERKRMDLEIEIGGKTQRINPDQQQTLSLLISTYEAAMRSDAERREAERAMRKAKAAAEAANEAKSQFLASMSHEIRTPMNAIIGLSDLALKTGLSTKQLDYLTKIHSSAKILLGILNDILDFSKIEAGKLDIEKIPFNLEESLKNVANLLSERANEKGLELLFNPGPKLVKGLIGDPLRLGQVLINLGNNAIKFTEKGEVEIKVAEMERKEDQVTLKFQVRDTGIGISEQGRKRLFRAFNQADISTTRRFGGTGLGLAISKRLVEMMDGEIWVQSTLGEGSTFGFTAVFGLSDTKPLHPRMTYEELRGLRVLVVDDNELAREIMTSMLETMSFRVDAVGSGKEGIEALVKADREDPYLQVIIDWQMPEMDGYETIRRIRRDRRISHQPKIIMATAYGREEVMVGDGSTQLDGILLKPITPSLFFNAVVAAFCKEKNHHCAKTPPPPAEEDEPKISLAGNLVLLVEDNEINQQVAQEILQQAGLEVEVAVNGKEAVEAVQARYYDAVFMDVQMPVMDGYEASRRIRQDPRFADLPIIAMTAGAMTGDREKALDAGMDDFVTKPIDTFNLFDILQKYITAKHADKQASPPQPDEAAASNAADDLPEIPGLNIESSLKRLGGNRAMYRKLLRDFASSQAGTLDKVRQALTEGRREDAQVLLHTLKGVAGNLGADVVYDKSHILESIVKDPDSAEFDAAVDELEEALQPFIEALSSSLAAASKVEPAPNKTLDWGALYNQLGDLEKLLDESDLDAVERLADIRAQLTKPPYSTLCDEVEKHLAKFDFSLARATLERLMDLAKRKLA